MSRNPKRLRPCNGWKHLDGPPGHGKSSVWEHPSGARLHAGGLLRPDMNHHLSIDANNLSQWSLLKLCGQMQPRRIRALMVWAESILQEQSPKP